MKLKAIKVNNRTKQMVITYVSGKKVSLHYGQLGIKKNINRAWIDEESGRRTVGFEYEDNSQEFMPYDQPLALARDANYLLQNDIEVITAKIKAELNKQSISKKYLAKQLGTSVNQVHRLLNPKILNKNLEQLYGICAALGLKFELRLRKAS